MELLQDQQEWLHYDVCVGGFSAQVSGEWASSPFSRLFLGGAAHALVIITSFSLPKKSDPITARKFTVIYSSVCCVTANRVLVTKSTQFCYLKSAKNSSFYTSSF
jgi:hypothetical protein